ncbi:Pre-mRNA-splicing factor slt11 [Xylographa carneopallida]|nr:Pre-mRNA-splicing factor slt11 [Xylographa carneopallida]
MVAPGPESSINREYYAQENEHEIEEGRGGLEEYEKTDQKARELLRRLANSEPYYKRQRRLEATEDSEKTGAGAEGQKRLSAGPGPIRTHDGPRYGSPSMARGGSTRGGRGGLRSGRAFPSTAQLPPGPQDILPPRDHNVTSLFVTGVEDDLPEHAIRTFFTPFGTLRSVVCSHRAHCAFINYATREGAEAAAEACQGKAVISGCPLRVQWGRPRPLDNMEKEERFATARQGRDTVAAIAAANRAGGVSKFGGESSGVTDEAGPGDMNAIAPPPGRDDVQYASLAGD